MLAYDEYASMGGSLNKADYERFAVRAWAVLNAATHYKVKSEQPVRMSIKWALYDLTEAMQRDDANGGQVTSVTNDGVTMAYSVSGNMQTRYTDIMRMYLSAEVTADGTPLLYSGVD